MLREEYSEKETCLDVLADDPDEDIVVRGMPLMYGCDMISIEMMLCLCGRCRFVATKRAMTRELMCMMSTHSCQFTKAY
jgi:hypothetical protein